MQAIIESVVRLAKDGQSELRALLANIRSDGHTCRGLIAELATLAAHVQARSGIAVHVSLGDEPDVPSATEEGLLLIAREALHNVVKHAGAERVELVLANAAEELLLVINDDVRGFDPAVSRPGHFGLQSLRERATEIGSTLERTTADGLGTQIRVRIPQVREPDG